MSTPEEVLSYAEMDPEFAELWSKAPPVLDFDGSVSTLRNRFLEAKKKFSDASPKIAGVTERDSTVLARDGHAIPIRVYKPEIPPPGGSPVVIALHGGGFCIGGLVNEELQCRLISKTYGAVCVNVDYRLAPENPFPAPVNDCWDATKWVAANVSSLEANPSAGFIVFGTSAGGNMTDVVGHLARDEKLSPPLTGLLEIVPSLMSEDTVPDKYRQLFLSRKQNVEAPLLGSKLLRFFDESYKPERTNPLFVPFANQHGHNDLPPVYLQVCGLDPLRDDALIYEKHLREETNTRVKLMLYKGLPHGFWSAFPMLSSSTKFVGETVQGVGWLLNGGRD